MTRYLLDTNHLSRAIRRVSVLRDRIGQHRLRGDRFATCVPILCELEVGIQQTHSIKENHRRLTNLRKSVAVWPIDSSLIPVYARYYGLLRSRGRVLGQIDLLLAALATSQNATLLTGDLDFAALPEVSTENWLQ